MAGLARVDEEVVVIPPLPRRALLVFVGLVDFVSPAAPNAPRRRSAERAPPRAPRAQVQTLVLLPLGYVVIFSADDPSFVLVNMVTMCDVVMAEFVPEIASVAPPAVGAAARPTTIIVLKGLLDRLVSAQETTPEDIDLAWREASAEDDEKLLEMQLCVLLSDIVCLKERERFFRAAVVVTSAVITVGDTVSDVNVIALYWGSAFGTILMIHFVVAVVSGGRSSRPPSFSSSLLTRALLHRYCKLWSLAYF